MQQTELVFRVRLAYSTPSAIDVPAANKEEARKKVEWLLNEHGADDRIVSIRRIR